MKGIFIKYEKFSTYYENDCRFTKQKRLEQNGIGIDPIVILMTWQNIFRTYLERKYRYVFNYASDELLIETVLQNSTASICDTPSVEVVDNDINMGIAEYEMTTGRAWGGE